LPPGSWGLYSKFKALREAGDYTPTEV